MSHGDPVSVVLKPELQRFVAKKISAGEFTDASGVVNEALEILKDQEDFTAEHETYLRTEIQRGIEQLDRGEVSELSIEQIIAEER